MFLCHLSTPDITQEDRELAASFSPIAGIAIRYGAMIGDGDPQTYVFEMQKHECLTSPLPLLKAQVIGFGQEGSELTGQFSFVWDGVEVNDVNDGPHDATGLYFDFQWLRGDKAGHFVEIPGAYEKTYRTTVEDVGCALKVECTPVINVEAEDFGETVFAITNLVVPGKVLGLVVSTFNARQMQLILRPFLRRLLARCEKARL